MIKIMITYSFPCLIYSLRMIKTLLVFAITIILRFVSFFFSSSDMLDILDKLSIDNYLLKASLFPGGIISNIIIDNVVLYFEESFKKATKYRSIVSKNNFHISKHQVSSIFVY